MHGKRMRSIAFHNIPKEATLHHLEIMSVCSTYGQTIPCKTGVYDPCSLQVYNPFIRLLCHNVAPLDLNVFSLDLNPLFFHSIWIRSTGSQVLPSIETVAFPLKVDHLLFDGWPVTCMIGPECQNESTHAFTSHPYTIHQPAKSRVCHQLQLLQPRLAIDFGITSTCFGYGPHNIPKCFWSAQRSVKFRHANGINVHTLLATIPNKRKANVFDLANSVHRYKYAH